MTEQKLPPTFKDFNPKRLRLSLNKKKDVGTIYISFDDGANAVFYIPKCRLAHGVNAFDSKVKKSVPPTSPKDNCSFSIDINEDLEYFLKAWEKIENEIKMLIAKDSKTLLGKSYTLEEVNKLWASKLKEGGLKDKENEQGERYNASLSIKQQFDWDTGVSKTKYFDGQNDNEPLNITYLNASTEIPRGSICMMYLRLYKITFGFGQFHTTLYPTQVSINRPTSKDNFAPLPIASDNAIGRVRDEADNDDHDTDNGKEPAFEVNNDEIESEDDDIASDNIKQVATPRKVTKKTPAPTTKDVKPRGRAKA